MFTMMVKRGFVHEGHRVKAGMPIRVNQRTASLYLSTGQATLVKPNENIERQARKLKADMDEFFRCADRAPSYMMRK
jgi:hypothetical protein